MNWGYRIILFYALFVLGIVFMAVKSSMQNNDLVTPDYYEKELNFQTTIDATNRANALSAKLVCMVNNDTMNILFPTEMKNIVVKANVWLYFIADKKKDIKIAMETMDGMIKLPLTENNKGLHDVKISWAATGVEYYYEQKIFLQW